MQTGEKSPGQGVVGSVLDASTAEPALDASTAEPALDASTAEPAIHPSAAEREDFINFLDGEYALVLRFVMRCGAGLQGAQDAAQEAFLAAWIELGRGRWAEIANQRGWIRRVALYQCLRLQGRSKKRQALPVADFADMPQPGPDHADLTEGTIFVNEALSVLDPELRAVMAFDMDGFTAGESGRLLGLTDQQIRDRRKKARRILAKHLAGVNALEGESV
jgi:RNA polymerase sigma factor (sigma-70 family)